MRLSLGFFVLSLLVSLFLYLRPIVIKDGAINDSETTVLELLPAPIMAVESEFSSILNRKLFLVEQRLFKDETLQPIDEKVEEHFEELNFSLLGVLLGGAESRAIIEVGDSDEVRHWRLGDEFGGWTLDEVSSNYADFSSKDENTRLYISKSLDEINSIAGGQDNESK